MSSITKNNQAGIVAIITVMFLALILSMITLGFMRIMTRNQRQALDAQLSTQAFYAADSGVEDAVSALNNAIANNVAVPFGNSCGVGIAFVGANSGSPSNILDANSKYSCVLFDNRAPDIIADDATQTQGKFYQIKSPAGNLDSVRIFWGDDDQVNTMGNTNLVKSTQWTTTTPPMLRVTVYSPASYARSAIIGIGATAQKTVFLVPGNSASGTLNDGDVAMANCAASPDPAYQCSAVITFPNLTANQYVRIKPIYNESNIKIEGLIGGTPQILIGAQYVIDVTGRSSDVYRRVSVRIPIKTDYNYPEGAIESQGNICKQFKVTPLADSVDESPGTACDFAISPLPGGGNTSASANFSTNCNNTPTGCGGFGVNNDPFALANWQKHFINNSSKSAPSCTWNWGDGSTTTYNTVADCTPGVNKLHTYAGFGPPSNWTCRNYTVVLTMNYSPGPSGTKTSVVSMPDFKQDGTRC